jgi:hypothetical protein
MERNATIITRIDTLLETLDTAHQSLSDCPSHELSAAVRFVGRILNVFNSAFDFSPSIDAMINPRLNSLLIRQWSKSESHLLTVKAFELEIIDAMKTCMKKRLA